MTVTANPPFSVIDWTVAIVLIPVFSSCPDPGQVEFYLGAPTGYATYPAMAGLYNLGGCSTYSGIPIYDNQTIWGSPTTTSSMLCSANAFTGNSNGYQDPSSNWLCFSGTSCSFGTQSGNFISDPFAVTYQKGGGTAAGTWKFGMWNGNSNLESTLKSWAIQFYREAFSPPCLPSSSFI